MPVIFVLRTVAAYNVRRLVRHRVNFIIPQKQMFIPDLLIDLKPHKNNIGEVKKRRFLQLPNA